MAITNVTVIENDPELIAMQAQWAAEAQEAEAEAQAVKDSAISKLKAIGLTDAEIEAIRSL
jgi:hypothetical protein